MKFITLYESATTDGYTTQGNGRYFSARFDVEKDVVPDKGHGRIIEHPNVIEIDGQYYELKSRSPITLSKPRDVEETIKKNALAKLTKEEQQLLGIWKP